MNDARHVVRKQIYELELVGHAGARELQARIDKIHHDSVTGVLDEVMSAASPGDDVHLIERLELDLGVVAPDDVEVRMTEGLGETLRRALTTEIAAARAAGAGDTAACRSMPAADAKREALQAFLLSGLLPWWAAGEGRATAADLLDELFEGSPERLRATLRSLPAGTTARRLVRQFSAQQVRRVRLLLAGTAVDGTEAIAGEWITCLKEAVGPGGPIALPGSPGKIVITASLEALLSGAVEPAQMSWWVVQGVASASGLTRAEVVERLLPVAARTLPTGGHLRSWIEVVEREPARRQESARARRAEAESRAPHAQHLRGAGRAAAFDKAPAGETDAAKRPRAAPTAKPSAGVHGVVGRGVASKEHAGAADSADHAAREHHPQPWDSSVLPGGQAERLSETSRPHAVAADSVPPTELSAADLIGATRAEPAAPGAAGSGILASVDPYSDVGILIGNAGLVLAWPFLPRFFTELGLLDDGEFVDEMARERAVVLLEYVATGKPEAPEYAVLLNKLLCGWPREEPVAVSIELRAAEQREVEELYASILGNWKALGSTSSEGLRGSFIRRQGSLVRQEMDWNLKIARTGYDILLDQLPWGIGFIMQPWMKEPVVVEW